MRPADLMDPDMSSTIADLRARDEPFAFATIVRTAGLTAAKPGAKALLAADGTILHGWLGGGCTRAAVKRAAQQALQSATPKLISVTPEELLDARSVRAGEEQDGVTFARNGCPSEGTVDIFIEPCLPSPELVIFGDAPVARALADLAPRFHWDVATCPAESNLPSAPATRRRVVVVATQGKGDLAALKTALSAEAEHVSFVGSHKKYASLATQLEKAGVSRDLTQAVAAPAGLDIKAVTPEEIALSILAELIAVRRTNQRLCRTGAGLARHQPQGCA